MNVFLRFGLVVSLLFSQPGFAAEESAPPKRKVIFFGIDGLRNDSLIQAMESGSAPALKGLVDGGSVTWKAFAGGLMGGKKQQPTISGPGWSTFLTGVYTDRHGVIGNAKEPYNTTSPNGSYQVDQAPAFATRLKEKNPDARIACLASWDWIEDYFVGAQPASFDFHKKGKGANYAESDEDVTQIAESYLASENPDVMIVHLCQVDGAGHASGFSMDNPDYMRAIHVVDGLVDRILKSIAARPDAAREEWLVAVSTDHGGKGKSHGGQSLEERTIFLLLNGPGIHKGAVIDRPAGQAVLPRLIFRFLGVPVDESWGWEKENLSTRFFESATGAGAVSEAQ